MPVDPRYAAMFADIAMISLMVDRDQRISHCNDFTLSTLGLPRSAVIGVDLARFLSPADTGSLRVIREAIASGSVARHTTGVIRTARGEDLTIRWHNTVLRDPDGTIAGLATVGEDITEARRAASRERRQREFYAALLRTNSAIVRIGDPDELFREICRICVDHGHASIAYISVVDGAWARPVAWAGPAKQILGEGDLALDPDRPEGRSATAAAILRGERSIVNDVHADPDTLPFRKRIASIGTRAVAAFPFHRGGQVIGALALHMTTAGFFDEPLIALIEALTRDLSFALDNIDRVASLARNEQSRIAQVAAETASRAKTHFLTRMSHELRTPLNAVIGFSQVLQADEAGSLSKAQAEQVEYIRQAGWHLLALVNDVLDVASIEAGKVRIEAVPVDAFGLVTEVVSLSKSLARDLGVSLHVDAVDLRRLPMALADSSRLRQVLINLLSNAIKYNRHGGSVRVSVGVVGDQVRLTVTDTGLGMSQEQLAHLYEPFNRLGRESSAVEGTGLGLSLSRQLILLMKGSVHVESEVEIGTRFDVRVPAAEAEVSQDPPDSAAGWKADEQRPCGTVLYIEDNPVNMILVEEMLACWPTVHLLQAEDGTTGIEMAINGHPDVVLLDMQLPDLSGQQVLQRLRATPSTRHLPIIALSASAMQDAVDGAAEAGANDYWTKPFEIKQFLRRIARLLPAEGTLQDI